MTQAGRDVLGALRSYLATRGAPFVVPGREFAADDRREGEARCVLAGVPRLAEFARWAARRREPAVLRLYSHPAERPRGSLRFYVHDEWPAWRPVLEAMREPLAERDVRLVLRAQPFTPEDGRPQREILVAEFDGPHDLLRWLADDCEARWTR